MEKRQAVIIRLPLRPRSCGDCYNAAIGKYGVFCDEYGHPVWDEVQEAADCESFQPH